MQTSLETLIKYGNALQTILAMRKSTHLCPGPAYYQKSSVWLWNFAFRLTRLQCPRHIGSLPQSLFLSNYFLLQAAFMLPFSVGPWHALMLRDALHHRP